MAPIMTSVDYHPERLIIISGNGQNVGKTTFACQLIQHLKRLKQKVYALKVSPHVHNEKLSHSIFVNEYFILSLEKNKNTGKDSSRYLDAGADESFFLQVNDGYLEKALKYTFSFFPKNVFVIAESGGMRNLIKPQLFFFLKKTSETSIKEKALKWPDLADKVIEFDGSKINFDVDKIQIENKKIILNN